MSESLNAAASDIDLFAGAGGWEEGIAELGVRPLGIEWNADACATRIAAGHPTLQADVSALDPLDFAPCRLLIASPPCPTFSSAGDGNGYTVVPTIFRCATELCLGKDTRVAAREEAYGLLYPDVLAAETKRAAKKRKPVDLAKVETKARRDATMSLLVVEPLRWALALRPESIALEQVPGVLPIWRAMGEMLRRFDYWTWAGKLNAETFGVPQTRERAFLMASLRRHVHPPRATHQTYVYGVPAAEQHTLEGTLKPWVSMAEALGWGMTERPVTTLTAGTSRQGGPDPLDGGSGARATVEREREERGFSDVIYVNGSLARAARRPATAPAPTIHFGDHMNDVRWYDRRQGPISPGGVRTMVRLIPDTEPAPTISTASESRDRWVRRERSGDRSEEGFDPAEMPSQALTSKTRSWTVERPSTSVIFQPGEHHEPGQQSENSISVAVSEAAVLQSFPADYPWQGSRTAIFTQIGNAVPPLMARAVVAALLGLEIAEDAA